MPGVWGTPDIWLPGGFPPVTAAGALVFRGRSAGRHECWHLLLSDDVVEQSRDAIQEALERVCGQKASAEWLEKRRMAGGVPAIPVELGPGDLPQEGGLEAEAVSFNKGCYLGQEVMARLQSMGRVRRRLHIVQASREVPAEALAPGTELLRDEKKLGEIRSGIGDADGWTGLAMLQDQGFKSGDLLFTRAGVSLEMVALAEGRAW